MCLAGEITDELYDELEEQLILADTGAGVAVRLVEELRSARAPPAAQDGRGARWRP